MRNKLNLLGSVAMAASLACIAGAASAQERPAGDDRIASTIGEVVVTAERRAVSVQDVPVSVTAISAEQIAKTFAHNLADFSRAAPNFTIEGVGSTSRSSAVVYSRGIGFASIDGVEPPIAVSVDGLFYAVNTGALHNVFDVKQIEILQGPQGTLFGRNSTGGVIQIVTNDPTPDYEVSGTIRVGNYGRFDSNVTANLPITDTLAARISLNTQNSDGFYRNLYTDPASGARPGDTHTGGDNTRAIRGKLRWTPSDDLTVQLTAWYTRQRQDSPGGQRGSGPTDLLYSRGLPNVNSTVTGRPGIGYPGGPTDPFTINRDNNGLDNLDQKAAVLDIRYATDYGFDVTSVTGVLKYKAQELVDFDGSDLNMYTSDIHRGRRQFSQELRLQSNDPEAKLRWQGGVFFFQTRWQNLQTNLLGPALTSQTNATSPVNRQNLAAATYNRSTAAFGQADYEVIPKLILTAGARYTFEKKRTTDWSGLASLAKPYGTGFTGAESWDDITYRLAARYEINDDLMVYTSYSTGQKAGGFSNTATSQSQMTPYSPEKAKSLEGGFRSEWLDHRVRVNGTVFTTKYSDLQVSAFRPVTGGSGQQAFVANSAFERAKGVELQATALPIRGLELSASVGYLDAKYTSFVSALSYNFPGHVCNGLTAGPGSPPIAQDHAVKGTPCYLVPPRSPKWTAKLQASYDIDLGEHGVLTPHVVWAYQGAQFTNLTNAPQGFQGAYSIWDADLTYNEPQGRWRVSLFAKNITNKTHIINANPIAGLFNVNYYADPKTYGAELGVKFR
ncbi:MAG: TonB-dependent receptor [Alphaproteobacteria bacterium]|nr:TonB-dependent receptor [Alphaproteobacteria bacterium]MBU1514331.1 TonB-dependent receptor [Alphaproteobacteria bacterium]MBU2095975.1 TonB-dependent receptor [Alphaproteobacteria bacterium]MBU2153073.1 TonB-dependent receptor [Alphaproteobacteria bacterium]MBU2308530.1 TonB-dependent receptor [Alphaproteobacteria bacterium]